MQAVSAEEAQAVLGECADEIDIAFIAVDLPGEMDGFVLAKTIRERAEGIRVACRFFSEGSQACQPIVRRGPHLRKPYEPQTLVDWIKRLRIPK